MRTFQLNKLVRDEIVPLTLSYGGAVKLKKLDEAAINEALVGKLIEESVELKNSELSVEEIADLQEIIDQLCENLRVSREELIAIQKQKRTEKGGFKNGDFVETVSLPAEHKWAKYYASDPRRFPEITT